MDIRSRKLRLALWIMGLGTLVAIIWHGWQGWGLGRGYPDNTYLCVHQAHFTDWTGVVAFSQLPTPYAHQFAFYFPATYVMFQPFVWLDRVAQPYLWDSPDAAPPSASLFLYLLTVLVAVVLLQRHLLCKIVPEPMKRLMAVLVLTIGSYAFVFCFDRANVELGMAVLTAWALLLCRRQKFLPAVALLSIPILLKLYPLLLLALFIRRRHLRYLGVPAAACLVLSVLALLTFSSPIPDCLALWKQNLTQYNFLYIVADRGLAGCASPWNVLKIGFLTADYFRLIDLHLVPLSTGDHYSLFFIPLSQAYNDVFLGLLLGLVLFATFIEREFFRRAVLFLLFMTICAQAGADYKLLWVHVALIVLILVPTRRPLDLAAVALMALVLVPKKELYLPYLGYTDTTYNDVSFGVIANPILIFIAIALVIIDGWRARIPGWALPALQGLGASIDGYDAVAGTLAARPAGIQAVRHGHRRSLNHSKDLLAPAVFFCATGAKHAISSAWPNAPMERHPRVPRGRTALTNRPRWPSRVAAPARRGRRRPRPKRSARSGASSGSGRRWRWRSSSSAPPSSLISPTSRPRSIISARKRSISTSSTT